MVEEKRGVSLKNLRTLRDKDFVSYRNKVAHPLGENRDVGEIAAIRQFNLISATLTEMGFKDFPDYQTTKFNRFAEAFKKAESEYSRTPRIDYKINENIISRFREGDKPIDILNEITRSKDNFIIVGEGGFGKSTTLRYISERFGEYNAKFVNLSSITEKEDFRPIPIMISATELRTGGDIDLYDKDLFIADIARLCGDSSRDILAEARRLAALATDSIPESKPFFIILLDGFNNITDSSKSIRNEFQAIIKELEGRRIQMVITSGSKSILAPEYGDNIRSVYAQGLEKEQE